MQTQGIRMKPTTRKTEVPPSTQHLDAVPGRLSIQNTCRWTAIMALAALVFTATSAFAETTIFSDGFEGTFPGSWTVGNDGGITTAMWGNNSAKTSAGSFSAFCADNGSNTRTVYDNNLKTFMERRSVSLAGYTAATLNFKYWLNSEPGYDFFTVNVRDQAQSWHEVMKVSGNHSGLGWQTTNLNLSAYAGQTGLYIQFRFDSDGRTTSAPPCGVWVDEVSLVAANFTPYFYDARITNPVDQDRDGYAREFDIEFDVDSNVAGNYYVKIWEDDPWPWSDDYLTTSAIFAVNGLATDYRSVHIRCSDYPGADYLSHGMAEFALELYNAANNSLVQTWTASDDPELGNVLVELSTEDVAPVLSRSPSGLTQTVAQGQNASSQSFTVFNSGGGHAELFNHRQRVVVIGQPRKREQHRGGGHDPSGLRDGWSSGRCALCNNHRHGQRSHWLATDSRSNAYGYRTARHPVRTQPRRWCAISF